eukprot:8357787-Pyramimonas_sp.AAC.1
MTYSRAPASLSGLSKAFAAASRLLFWKASERTATRCSRGGLNSWSLGLGHGGLGSRGLSISRSGRNPQANEGNLLTIDSMRGDATFGSRVPHTLRHSPIAKRCRLWAS